MGFAFRIVLHVCARKSALKYEMFAHFTCGAQTVFFFAHEVKHKQSTKNKADVGGEKKTHKKWKK